MTTPIEKAAAECFERYTRTGKYSKARLMGNTKEKQIEEFATIIRRVLSEEVPKMSGSGYGLSHLDGTYTYDLCRHDIGLE